MEIKKIQDIAKLDNIALQFAVSKNMGEGDQNYNSDVVVTTKDWKTVSLSNISLRDALFCLGEAVLSAEDMEIINKYVYECKKCLERGNVDFNCPGYIEYHYSRVGRKEFYLDFGGGYRKYQTLDELYKDAKEHKASKKFERVVNNALYGYELD